MTRITIALLVFIAAVLLLSPRTASAIAVTPVPGNCVEDGTKDETAPFTITVGASSQINGVRVKAGNECFNVTTLAIGTTDINGCYSAVLSADRKTITVTQTGAGPVCKGISHLVVLSGYATASPTASPTFTTSPSPTASPTPTSSPTPTASPTVTATTTPTASPTPTSTPTSGGGGGSSGGDCSTEPSLPGCGASTSTFAPTPSPTPRPTVTPAPTLTPNPCGNPPLQPCGPSLRVSAPPPPVVGTPAPPRTGNAGMLGEHAGAIIVLLAIAALSSVLAARVVTGRAQ